MMCLFEPWNLGDAVIALATAREARLEVAIAASSSYGSLLGLLGGSTIYTFIPVDLAYTRRVRGSPWITAMPIIDPSLKVLDMQICSIRGDIRDYIAARKLFAHARIDMRGWLPFAARKFKFLDTALTLCGLPVRNRYDEWARILGRDSSDLWAPKRHARAPTPLSDVLIHLGAQWRSKRFPMMGELAAELRARGVNVKICKSKADPLPSGCKEDDVISAEGERLVDLIKASRYVVANDSGPAHVAAFLGVPTVILARASNIEEWLPPGAWALCTHSMPKGYRPDRAYCSDQVLSGWVTLEQVMAFLTSMESLMPGVYKISNKGESFEPYGRSCRLE